MSLGVEVVQDVVAIVECLLVVGAADAVVCALEWITRVCDVNKYMLTPAYRISDISRHE